MHKEGKKRNEPPHDKTNKIAGAPSEDSDQPGHPPSLIRVFAVRMNKAWVLSYPLSASEDSDQTGRCPGWSESSLGAHATLLVLSWGGSNTTTEKVTICKQWDTGQNVTFHRTFRDIVRTAVCWQTTIIRAASSEFVSSSIPSWKILTAHAQPFRAARDLAFCLKVPLDSLLVWASSEGSAETARMRRLAWTFAARIGD